jgi:hypothetical protein
MNMITQPKQHIDALTRIHSMHYNVGIMNNSTTQITVRGLDPATKDALMKKANQQGVSLNRYALKALQYSAGIDDSEKRYQALKQFFKAHHMAKGERKAFDEAIAWADKASLEKQRRDEGDNSI